MRDHKIGVIGGGAAGMMAAVTAARQGVKVTLLEGGERIGKKILSTGNGKCNLGNLQLDEGAYYGSNREWIANALRMFDTQETICFFRDLGLMLKEKNGYLYPASEQASTVLDVLRAEIRCLGITVVTNRKVQHIGQDKEGRFVVSSGDDTYLFDRVIIACGGKAAPKTGSDGSGYKLARQLGHTLIPVVPALVQLRCKENYLKEVAGVRAEAALRVLGVNAVTQKSRETCLGRGALQEQEIAERGELQITDYGISGIPVFQLSRKVNYLLERYQGNAQIEMLIDFLPDYTNEDLQQFYVIRKLLLTDRTVEEFFTGLLHKKLMQLFIKLAGLKAQETVEEADGDKLWQVFWLCKNWRLHVTGSNSYDCAQVCAGGVDTDEVDGNMESRLVPGLYFAGEILDVDGRCGGYNLQWAWSSGYIAGCAAAKKEKTGCQDGGMGVT